MRTSWQIENIKKTEIKTIQVNLGDRCNQRCFHCHIEASPYGSKNMDEGTAKLVLENLIGVCPDLVEFTGGAPEINPNLSIFIERLSSHGIKTAVRTNLTVLDMPAYSFFIDLYSQFRVKIVASLPDCFKDETDRQRGKGVFEKSIKILKRLNEAGYGTGGLDIDLVHNPTRPCLTRDELQLENDYRKILNDNYGISFNRLISITNVPIGGFKRYLLDQGNYEDYMRLLVNNFNAETIDRLMCRRLLSIDYQGYVYDCDFNLSLGIKIKDYEDRKFWEIDFDDFNPEISCGEHCYACTASAGSSCHGSLIKNNSALDVKDVVKHYYGAELKSTSDLKTGACCTTDSLPAYVREVIPLIEPEIRERYYGCGSPIPPVLNGLKVLDIGCGTGRDTYVLSRLVGDNGQVYGIDMTAEQIAIAKKYILEQTRKFGYSKPNITFIHDYIENLKKYFEKNSLDLVISNCVVNLIEDKEGVIKQVYDILKFGGEFYFSDIYADRRLPEELRNNEILYGECLSGALYSKDFERIARRAGFIDPRVVSRRVVKIKNESIQILIGNITFYSVTYRLWKLEGLEDACEDYGHIAVYKGGIKESPFSFALDSSHVFEKDKPERVCGNTALMLSATKLKDYFEVIGDFEQHFGAFISCGTTAQDKANQDASPCC